MTDVSKIEQLGPEHTVSTPITVTAAAGRVLIYPYSAAMNTIIDREERAVYQISISNGDAGARTFVICDGDPNGGGAENGNLSTDFKTLRHIKVQANDTFAMDLWKKFTRGLYVYVLEAITAGPHYVDADVCRTVQI